LGAQESTRRIRETGAFCNESGGNGEGIVGGKTRLGEIREERRAESTRQKVSFHRGKVEENATSREKKKKKTKGYSSPTGATKGREGGGERISYREEEVKIGVGRWWGYMS